MSRFRIGQRIRLVHPEHAVNTGRTGIISSLFHEYMGPTYMLNCDVKWDEPMLRFGTKTHTSRLEPATDCYDVTSWDKCVWEPDENRVNS